MLSLIEIVKCRDVESKRADLEDQLTAVLDALGGDDSLVDRLAAAGAVSDRWGRCR